MVERVFVIGDRDGLALDAGDGDAGIGGDIAEVILNGGRAVRVRRDRVISEGVAVGRDGELAVVVALVND